MADKRKKTKKKATAPPPSTGRTANQPRVRHGRSSHSLAWLYNLVSGVLMFVAVVVACLMFFQVETVTAQDSTRYSAEDIIEASGLEVGQNLFLVNRTSVAQQISKSMPYLKTITIRRTLPGSVDIQVTECDPVAAITVANGYWHVDEDGKLLELCTDDGGLPIVVGISLVAPTTGNILELDSAYRLKKNSLISLLTALKDQELLADVISIDLSDGSQLVMQYTTKYTVKIPYGADFDYRIRAMNGIIENLAETNDTGGGVIDMTLESEWHYIPN